MPRHGGRPSLQTCAPATANRMFPGSPARRGAAPIIGRRPWPHLGEFELIERFFTRPARRAALGVGDDCALLAAGARHDAGRLDRHADRRPPLPLDRGARSARPQGARRQPERPRRLRRAAARVHARPRAAARRRRLPRRRSRAACSRSPIATAASSIGGDTTRGPLTICITVFGELPAGAALLRSGARPGDDVYVSGTLGDARLALEAFRGTVALDDEALRAGRARRWSCRRRGSRSAWRLRGLATSAIDVSDGLVGDLGHVLRRSGVGAVVDVDALPRSAVLAGAAGRAAAPVPARRRRRLRAGLHGAARSPRDAIAAAAARAGVAGHAHRPHRGRRRAAPRRSRRRSRRRAELGGVRSLPRLSERRRR